MDCTLTERLPHRYSQKMDTDCYSAKSMAMKENSTPVWDIWPPHPLLFRLHHPTTCAAAMNTFSQPRNQGSPDRCRNQETLQKQPRRQTLMETYPLFK